MAAAIKALNARIRSNPVSDYICSTHFWGPVSNFGIPIAAVMDTQKDPAIISGPMTLALTAYSATFMRYALAVTPKNPLLFACHVINFGSQVTQGYRYMQYWKFGGREASLAATAKEGVQKVSVEGKAMTNDAMVGAEKIVDQTKQKAGELKDRLTK